MAAVVRRLRDHGAGDRARAHRAGPRRRRLSHRRGARAAGVRAARRRWPLRRGRRDRRRRGAHRQVDRRGEPDHHRPPRGDRVPAQPDDRQGPPQLPALLALQAPHPVPRDAAVVHQDGSRDGERELPRPRARGDPRHRMGAGVGRGAHLRDDREPARLGALAPAPVGHADPGVLLHGLRRRARRGRDDGSRRRDLHARGRERVVDAHGRGARARGHDVHGLRRRGGQARAREGHRRRVVRVGRVVARDGSAQGRRRRLHRHRPVPRGLRPAPRLVPQLAARRHRREGPRAVQAGHHARLRARRERRRPRARRSITSSPTRSSRSRAPRCSGCGSRRSSSATT